MFKFAQYLIYKNLKDISNTTLLQLIKSDKVYLYMIFNITFKTVFKFHISDIL